MTAVTGTIFNIQRFSIHDGPGIRTTVFLKGCPLRCFWCHNPEGLRKSRELSFAASQCIGCGECARICPRGAHIRRGDQRVFLRSRCTLCGLCVKVCFTGALQWNGRKATVQEVIDEALLDRDYYANTGGGVTLSGGEPMLQPDFTLAVLSELRQRGISTALETTTYVPWTTLAAALPLTDLLMVDIKHLDPEQHRAATGVSNQRIVANIRRLAKTGKPVIFRTPVVPGVNDNAGDIAAIAAFIRELGTLREDGGAGLSLELLPFHQLASDKYAALDLEYRAEGLHAPSKEHMAALGEAARQTGIPVRVR